MNINRYNYEEYFLLYVDNELSAPECQAVESFVENNPDLEEELMMLKQTKLKVDSTLVMDDKSVLFKSEKDLLINLENYETFFLLYVDEELNVEERRAVEEFAGKHPSVQQELEILMKARITPDNSIVFPDKQLLYRKAGREKVMSFKVWRVVAVAAMLLVAVGIFWLVSGDSKSSEFAGTDLPLNEKNEGKDTQKTETPQKDQSNSDLIAESDKVNDEVEQSTAQPTQNKKPKTIIKKEETPDLADLNEPESPVVNDGADIRPRTIASVDGLVTEAKGSSNLTDNFFKIDQPIAQAKPGDDMLLTREAGEPDDLNVGPFQTKNKLRGFFRQVTRVVEKNTPLGSGEKKKLLIGNIEIALK